VENLGRDLRVGARSLAKSPAFTVTAVAVLALGIGAVAAIVSVANAALLHGLPYREPDQLVLLSSALRLEQRVQTMPVSRLDFEDWRARSRSFSALALYSNPMSLNLEVGGEARHASVELVDAAYLPLLGIEPDAGRSFTAQETAEAGAHRVALLSHALWGSLFGEGTRPAGQTLTLNGQRYEVVGVLPEGFRGLTDSAELWLPLGMAAVLESPDFLQQRRFRWLLGVGRLAPGIALTQAQEDLDGVARALSTEFPETNRIVGAQVRSLREAWYGDLRGTLGFLGLCAGLVLLVAMVNVAGLQLSRALARQRELAIRSSLGAERGRLLRQMLTESVLLSLLAGGVGLLLALLGTRALVASAGFAFKSFVTVRPDPWVLLATLAIAVVCGLSFGLAPAWLASRTRLSEVLKEGSKGAARGFGREMLQSSLVVAQIGLALALLAATGLLVKSFREMRQQELGFDAENLATLRVSLKGEAFAPEPARRQLVRAVLERFAGLPGAAGVAVVGPSIPTERGFVADFALETQQKPGDENKYLFSVHHVSPDYFRTFGIDLEAGRGFDLGDDETGAPVALVSAAVAERFWPGKSPLGQGLRFFRGPQQAPWIRVVGVARDVQHQGLTPDPLQAPAIYLPVLQMTPRQLPVLNLVVRAAPGASAASLLPTMRRELAAVAPALPGYDARTMQQRLDAQAAPRRFEVILALVLAGVALVLAVSGLYGVISYAVTRLRQEIGIRLALGAPRGRVLRMVLGRAAVLAAAGVGVGLVLTLATNRLLESRLHGLSATEPLILLLATLLLTATALAASFVPALRATSVPPTTVLKAD
jgi:putative ABC transport system permease protein